MISIETRTVKLSEIKLNPDNPRTITEKALDKLVKSLREFPEMLETHPKLIGFRTLTKNVSGIYVIFNHIDERIYIGSAVSIINRIGIHNNDLRTNRHHSKHLQNFYNKYGANSIGFALLCETEKTKAALIGAEQKYINYLNPAFNISMIAGSNMGIKKSDEQRRALSEKRLSMHIHHDEDYKRRMSIALSGKNNPMYGKSPNWGKKHKPETIQKMIASHPDVKGVNNPKYGIPQNSEATAKALITKRQRHLAKGRGIKVIKNGQVISIFHSSGEASTKLGVHSSSILRVCNGKWKACKGYNFEFTGEE